MTAAERHGSDRCRGSWAASSDEDGWILLGSMGDCCWEWGGFMGDLNQEGMGLDPAGKHG